MRQATIDEAARVDGSAQLVTERATAADTELVPAENSAVAMFERLARDPNVDVEKLERLIAMQERILAHNAKAAFDAAFAEMQGEIPAIIERAKTNNGTYAPLEDIVREVRPVLQRHGFSLSHETQWPDPKTVLVIGILTHRQGHEKRTQFLSSADSSGNKNAIQGLGSAIAYGRRYTTKDLLNITTRGEDDDAQSAGRKKTEKPAPAGYDEWFTDLQATADEGWDKYRDCWNKSKKEYRSYLTDTAPMVANKLQLRAKGVK